MCERRRGRSRFLLKAAALQPFFSGIFFFFSLFGFSLKPDIVSRSLWFLCTCFVLASHVQHELIPILFSTCAFCVLFSFTCLIDLMPTTCASALPHLHCLDHPWTSGWRALQWFGCGLSPCSACQVGFDLFIFLDVNPLTSLWCAAGSDPRSLLYFGHNSHGWCQKRNQESKSWYISMISWCLADLSAPPTDFS